MFPELDAYGGRSVRAPGNRSIGEDAIEMDAIGLRERGAVVLQPGGVLVAQQEGQARQVVFVFRKIVSGGGVHQPQP